MHKIREIIRLAFDTKLSGNDIAKSLGVSRAYAFECVRRAKNAELSWPLPESIGDDELEGILYGNSRTKPAPDSPTEPDWEQIFRELKKKGVNLSLLWQEYCECAPRPLSYSQFCKRYKKWLGKINLVMRQEHLAGEKLFVDYAGQTMHVTDPETGEVHEVQMFVAAFGASNYSYAEATWTQQSDDWIGAHIRAFESFGGVPQMLVPDNLKVGITKWRRWDPEINAAYHRMAEHYGTSVVPARPAHPKDKAKVEKSVQVIETWIIAALRNRSFFSLQELNSAIKELVEDLNNRPFKKLTGTRREWFETIDKPALKKLPAERYEDQTWRKVLVDKDYHIEHEEHFYSIPHTLVGEEVFVRITCDTIECFHKSKRVASHKLDPRKREKTTTPSHMAPAHKALADWTPDRVTRWAEKIGPAAAATIKKILDSCKNPQHGVGPCRGILSLEKEFGRDRLENACRRALSIGMWSVTSIRSTLKHGLDRTELQLAIPSLLPISHENIRGAQYFKGEHNDANTSNTDETTRAAAPGNAESIPSTT